MKRKSRLISLFLVLAMLFTTVPALAYNAGSLVPQKRPYQTAFADTKGTWCDSAVQTCYEAGLIDGKSATRFAPKDSLTYAQITVISARFLDLLTGGDGTFPAAAAGETWYAPYYQGLMAAFETAGLEYYPMFLDPELLAENANVACSRIDFVYVLACVLESAEVPMQTVNNIDVVPDTDDPIVLNFYNAGILTGSDVYGTFRAADLLNRGQAAAMLARIVDPAQRQKFTPKTFDLCTDIYGIAPNATVLTVNGTAVTMEQFAYYLSFYLLTEYNSGVLSGAWYNQPEEGLQLAIQEMKNDFALEQLAKTKGISKPSASSVIADYGITGGLSGITKNGWVWFYTHLDLYYALMQKYGATADAPESEALNSALTPIENSLTVTVSAALDALDLNAAQTLLVASPYNT